MLRLTKSHAQFACVQKVCYCCRRRPYMSNIWTRLRESFRHVDEVRLRRQTDSGNVHTRRPCACRGTSSCAFCGRLLLWTWFGRSHTHFWSGELLFCVVVAWQTEEKFPDTNRKESSFYSLCGLIVSAVDVLDWTRKFCDSLCIGKNCNPHFPMNCLPESENCHPRLVSSPLWAPKADRVRL